MHGTTKRYAQIYLMCLVVIFAGMVASGCSGRRCSSCEGPYTVYHRPAGCASYPYANSACPSTTVRPQSRYWSDWQAHYNPSYSQGWYHSELPYRNTSRHRYFGTCGY